MSAFAFETTITDPPEDRGHGVRVGVEIALAGVPLWKTWVPFSAAPGAEEEAHREAMVNFAHRLEDRLYRAGCVVA